MVKSRRVYPNLSRAIEGFFIEKRGQGRSEDTLHEYNTTMKRFVEFTGDPPINSITAKTIIDFFIYLEKFRYSRDRTGKSGILKPLSPKTIFNYKQGLSSFFSFLSEEYGLEKPKMPRRSKNEKPVMPFTTDEVLTILKACDYSLTEPSNQIAYKSTRRTRLRDKAIIMFLFDTGVRASELCNIRFRDVDFDNSRVTITGKGKKQRIIQFGRNATRQLWKYHSARFPDVRPLPDDFLFADDENLRPMNRDSLRQLISGIGEKAGVKNAHPHRFRHTFAVEFLRNGGNVYQLQDLLGHTTLEMCRRYVTLATNDLKEIHRRASPGDHLLSW